MYTAQLPPFRMEMDRNVDFSAKVTIRSRVDVLRTIKDNLNENELRVFRRYSQLGQFIDWADKWDFSGQLVHYLLQRKIKTSKQRELWFAIGGKPLRFSMKEFALVSGLKTGALPSRTELERVTEDHHLMDELFGEGVRVTLDMIRNEFLNVPSEARSRKKVRLAFVYLLVGFLMAQDPKKNVDPFYFQIVTDLELFDSFPWGKLCFELIIDYLSIDMNVKYQERQKKKKTAEEKYNFYGFAHLFQVRYYFLVYTFIFFD